jgi:uncharacterized membrane protein
VFHSGGNLEFLINTNDKINIKGQTNDNQQKVQAIHAVVYEKKLLIELSTLITHSLDCHLYTINILFFLLLPK